MRILATGSSAGRLVITIMAAVSQREHEANGERTRDALRDKRGKGEAEILSSAIDWRSMAFMSSRTQPSKRLW